MPDNFTRQDERAGAYNVANFVPNFVVKSKVHIEIHKPVCKQSLWLAYFCSGTNQRLCLQTVCEYYYELLNLTKFGTKFATFREKLCEINCNGLNLFAFHHAIYNLIYSLPVPLWLGNYRHSFKGFQKLLGGGGVATLVSKSADNYFDILGSTVRMLVKLEIRHYRSKFETPKDLPRNMEIYFYVN
jgi:hypothetical protein